MVKSKKQESKCCTTNVPGSCKDGAIYCAGFIGALVYYISTATSFWMGVVGFFKALVWPAIIVFHALKTFGL
ncbi:hypothetical protein HN789_00665 [archaeon]|jgi:hypothetical protein|nr:hypothetical protein [archaeon]MBT4022040.1 hypothetical protein [archaeon]MBT4272653.1 hypothetical protein [archaeon]MBT4461451.1 hypothetical protein [archaeon]MBT4857779.1 hypothetical protein [archaeon]